MEIPRQRPTNELLEILPIRGSPARPTQDHPIKTSAKIPEFYAVSLVGTKEDRRRVGSGSSQEVLGSRKSKSPRIKSDKKMVGCSLPTYGIPTTPAELPAPSRISIVWSRCTVTASGVLVLCRDAAKASKHRECEVISSLPTSSGGNCGGRLLLEEGRSSSEVTPHPPLAGSE